MRACRLKIVTKSGGSEAVFEAEGALEEDGKSVRVRYRVEEDEGELIISEQALTMCRRGDCALETTFIEGSKSEMRLLSGELQGGIPVYTTRYRLKKEKSQTDIELAYELFTADDLQKFLLNIQLFFSEEK